MPAAPSTPSPTPASTCEPETLLSASTPPGQDPGTGLSGAPCPCGSGRPLAGCCGPLLDGTGQARTAEQLMRSRYTAFALGDSNHLVRTWHPATRPPALTLDPAVRWTGLQVLQTHAGAADDEEGVVTFRAHHHTPDGPDVLAETSRFVRRGRRRHWVYLDGRPAP